MLTTVLFDMGGTLEDIWYNEDTQRATCRRLLEVLRANGLEPGRCVLEADHGRRKGL